ncbi:MAG: hypothetical protein A4E45_02096 [Methanosaeta sp. PtaB.Bin039]|nr:MAG: hypothetical protein A4E45_02096 [Methanosaeta sp. PtaB.Bin039]HOT07773.1 hypothetical protein [Methanotrichaceae archaeon]HQF17706.1 hypothetical protein [Methanotrichaceae archaeon]HQI92318.1 hypothetical protein [Methanotrichaceae archaeon]HQJ29414.1 hypothetical protein [Methanotrichaceae archaeon]
MTMDETQKRLKELLSKGASEEEMLVKLSLAEGCGIKVWCQEQFISGSDKKVHRYGGYIKKCDDPAENVEPIYGDWLDGPCPGK